MNKDQTVSRLKTVIYRLRHKSPMGKKVDLTHEADILENEIIPSFEALNLEKGWGVRITRKDGTSFMSSGGGGILTPVWNNSNRKYAVRHKKELVGHGFKAKVVPVLFVRPIEMENK